MSCLKDLKISEIKKLKLVYYVQFGICLGNFVGEPYIIKYDCIERKKDFYKDYWLEGGIRLEEYKAFTTLQEAEQWLCFNKKNKEKK